MNLSHDQYCHLCRRKNGLHFPAILPVRPAVARPRITQLICPLYKATYHYCTTILARGSNNNEITWHGPINPRGVRGDNSAFKSELEVIHGGMADAELIRIGYTVGTWT